MELQNSHAVVRRKWRKRSDGRRKMLTSLLCCCCSVAKLCLTLCDPIDCGIPGSSILHDLPEFAQMHVHCKPLEMGSFFFFFLKLSSFFFFFWPFLSFFLFLIFICSGFCHTLKWNSHGFTCVPHPDPPSHLPPHLLPLGFPIAPGPSTCLMHPTWAGDPFHPR